MVKATEDIRLRGHREKRKGAEEVSPLTTKLVQSADRAKRLYEGNVKLDKKKAEMELLLSNEKQNATTEAEMSDAELVTSAEILKQMEQKELEGDFVITEKRAQTPMHEVEAARDDCGGARTRRDDAEGTAESTGQQVKRQKSAWYVERSRQDQVLEELKAKDETHRSEARQANGTLAKMFAECTRQDEIQKKKVSKCKQRLSRAATAAANLQTDQEELTSKNQETISELNNQAQELQETLRVQADRMMYLKEQLKRSKEDIEKLQRHGQLDRSRMVEYQVTLEGTLHKAEEAGLAQKKTQVDYKHALQRIDIMKVESTELNDQLKVVEGRARDAEASLDGTVRELNRVNQSLHEMERDRSEERDDHATALVGLRGQLESQKLLIDEYYSKYLKLHHQIDRVSTTATERIQAILRDVSIEPADKALISLSQKTRAVDWTPSFRLFVPPTDATRTEQMPSTKIHPSNFMAARKSPFGQKKGGSH